MSDMLSSINSSSGINRNLGLFFVAFLFYIAISIASTTDLMLFMPDSFIELPIIGINLPLKGFYVVAPFLILIFHYYLLLNLELHCQKLFQFSKEPESEEKAISLHPFIINYLITIKSGDRREILKFVIRISAFHLPLLTLFYILLRFADYQSYSISSLHMACIIIDLYLIYSQTPNIIKIFSVKNSPLAKKAGFGYMFLLWKFRLLNKLFRKKKFGTRTYVCYKNGIKHHFENVITLLGITYYIWFLMTISGYFGVLSGYWTILEYTFPKIIIENEVLVKYPEQKKLLQTDWLVLSKKEKLSKYPSVAGIDLSDRNLIYCNLSNCIMINAKLNYTDFNYSKLDNIILTGCSLYSTNFNSASLRYSDFSGANGSCDFTDADLTISNFSNTHLQGYFIRTELFSAIFDSSDLNNSRFTHANLSQVEILNSRFFATHFIGTNMQRSNIRNSTIDGCNFAGANIQNSQITNNKISDSNFDGTKLIFSDLSGTLFNTVSFNGAIFDSNKMNNTVICDSSFALSFSGLILELKKFFMDSFLFNSVFINTGDSMVINPYYKEFNKETKSIIDSINQPNINDTILVIQYLLDLSDSYFLINSDTKYLPFKTIDSLRKLTPSIDTSTLSPFCLIKAKYDKEFLEIRTKIIKSNPNAARSMFGAEIKYEQLNDGILVLTGLEDTLLFRHIKHSYPELLKKLIRTIPVEKKISFGEKLYFIKTYTPYIFPELFSVEQDFY